MKTIYKVIIVLLVVALMAMIIFPGKLQALLMGAIGLVMGVLFKAGVVTKKYQDEAEKLQKEKVEVMSEINELEKQADEIKQSGQDREEEVKKIEDRLQELKKKDQERKEKADKLIERMKTFLVVPLLVGAIMFAVGFGGDVVLADEVVVPEPEELRITIDDIKIPDNYEELLEQHMEAIKLMIAWQQLYFDEREEKLEAIELAEELRAQYEAERDDRLALHKTFDDLRDRVGRLELIIDAQNDLVMDLIEQLGSRSPFGLYGGVNIKPLEPLSSGVEFGVTYDF